MKSSTLVLLSAAGGVAAYQGLLGPDLQTKVKGLVGGLGGGQLYGPNQPAGGAKPPPSSAAGSGGSPPAAGAKPCDFVAYGGGRGRFVEDKGNGVFNTVWNDQVVYTGDKASAEAEFRRRCGG